MKPNSSYIWISSKLVWYQFVFSVLSFKVLTEFSQMLNTFAITLTFTQRLNIFKVNSTYTGNLKIQNSLLYCIIANFYNKFKVKIISWWGTRLIFQSVFLFSKDLWSSVRSFSFPFSIALLGSHNRLRHFLKSHLRQE